MVTQEGFFCNHLQHNKQYHVKVLLNSFHLNVCTRASPTNFKLRTTLHRAITMVAIFASVLLMTPSAP